MQADRFESDVLTLASRGVALTVANVARGLDLSLDEAERRLDDLAARGRLDLELNEDTGALFYVFRGLDVTPPPAALARVPRPWAAATPPRHVPQGPQKSKLWAAVWALLVPGLGLAYAAPWSVGLGAGLALWVVVSGLATLPLVGAALSSLALGVGTLASVVMGLRYTDRFNQLGRRAHLEQAPQLPWGELGQATLGRPPR